MKDKKNIIKNISFYIVVVLLISFVVGQAFAPGIAFKILGFRNFVVVSPSMEPVIDVNDLIVVANAEKEKLEAGDIISFYAYLPTNQVDGANNIIYSKQVVTHYLGEIIKSGTKTIYKTHPANSEEFDNWVDKNGNPTDLVFNDIIGEVKIIIPKIGIMSRLLANPIMIILVAANIGIIVLIVKLVKSLKKDANELE